MREPIKRILPPIVQMGWRFNHVQGKAKWTEGDRSQDKLKWRVYSMLPRVWEKENFKRGNPRGLQQTTSFWVFFSLENSCFTFTFYFHNKSLLNSLTIFLPLNSLSGREKESIH
jgi:hypothetical protein